MSRLQAFAPDEPELARPKAGRKVKPWCLWHKWRHGWWRTGRYRTRQEAEKAMADQVRKRHNPGGFAESMGFGWGPDRLRVLHESQGKPE